jgi:hypothetical protein
MKKNIKKTLKRAVLVIVVLNVLAIINLLVWATSSTIQQGCIAKLENGKQLNLYEKCSIYSMHVAIFSVGQFVSREAATQQFYMSYPHGKKIFKTTILKNLKLGRVGLRYTPKNLRVACALNGWYVKERTVNGHPMKYVHDICKYNYIHDDTIILGFHFNEGLLTYLQKVGWLFPYEFEYQST